MNEGFYWGYMLLQVVFIGVDKNVSGKENGSRVIPRRAVIHKQTCQLPPVEPPKAIF